MGASGVGNTLTIANSGTVFSVGAIIGYNAGANSNAVLVTGAGSVWNNNGSLYVGGSAAGNMLTIANGGAVFSSGGGLGTDSNTVTVTGAGSVWNSSGNLDMGGYGVGNTLTLTNGGAVSVSGDLTISGVAGDLTISAEAGASNNVVNMSSGQLTVTNGALNIGAVGLGQFNLSGGTAQVQQLLATNGAQSVIHFSGGTLISQGSVISNGQDFIIGDAGGNATFVALGGTHAIQQDLYIGQNSTGNQLLITNAATVDNGNGDLGYAAGANRNAVLVTGAVWSNSGSLDIGCYGASNTLTIANGGAVVSRGGALGDNPGANHNAVLVTGAGSTWNSGTFLLGSGGVGNMLTITNGGAVYSSVSFIGYSAGANSNAVLVTGAGSVWSNSGSLLVGNSGVGNMLTISSGGVVDAAAVAIAAHNTLTLSGGTLAASLSINSGATATGGGYYSGAVTNQAGGTLTPGAGGDTNYFNSLTLAGGSTNQFYIASSATHDLSVVSNGLSYTGSGKALLSLNLQDYQQNANATGAVIMLYENLGPSALDGTNDYFALSDAGPENGLLLTNGASFEAVGGSSTTNGFRIWYDYQANGTAGGGDSIALTVIPEPVSVTLVFLLGGAVLGWRRLRRWS